MSTCTKWQHKVYTPRRVSNNSQRSVASAPPHSNSNSDATSARAYTAGWCANDWSMPKGCCVAPTSRSRPLPTPQGSATPRTSSASLRTTLGPRPPTIARPTAGTTMRCVGHKVAPRVRPPMGLVAAETYAQDSVPTFGQGRHNKPLPLGRKGKMCKSEWKRAGYAQTKWEISERRPHPTRRGKQ